MPSYPYISGQGALVQTVAQLRKGFPGKVDAGYLQRFNIAPANESYVIGILKFLGLIDENGDRIENNTSFFFGNDDSFRSGLEQTMRTSYSLLFDEMGDDAFDTERDELTHWFRAADKTSSLVGQRQASTFQTLAALAGHGEMPVARSSTTKKAAAKSTAPTTAGKKAPPKVKDGKGTKSDGGAATGGGNPIANPGQGVGLTVRIEVNLPPGGDAETYDSIFASIKKHLMS